MLNPLYFEAKFGEAKIFELELERINYKLSSIKEKTDKERKKEIIEEYKETIFNLKEATGDGNYKDIESWTIEEITDFIQRKNRQISKAKNKNNAGQQY